MMIAAALAAIVGVYLLYQLLSFLRTYYYIRKIPGPPADFLFGHTLRLAKEPDDLVDQVFGWAMEYSPICNLWFGVQPFVFLSAPNEVEALLSSNKHISKSYVYVWTHPWLGTGLLTSDGEKWFKRRKLITPTFHFTILEGFVKTFIENSNILIEKLEEYADGREVNVWSMVTNCVLDSICETSMGTSVNAQSHSDSEYVNAVVGMSELIQERQRKPWLWNDIIYNLTKSGKKHAEYLKLLHGVTNQVIDEKMEERKREKSEGVEEEKVSLKKRRLALMDLLLAAHDEGLISREGIREEVDTFMFEGHDTTAAGINFSLHLIGSHPDVQTKLQEEVDEVFERTKGQMKVEDLKNMKYLECCIKEAQRIFPSVPFIGREVKEDFQIGGYTVPKGCSVGVLIGGLHRDPRIWPEPMSFKPERFTLENIAKRHTYSYVPFSAGPRNCVGQKFALLEEKTVLATILRHFTVESTQTIDEIRPHAELIMRPKHGIFVKLKPRN